MSSVMARFKGYAGGSLVWVPRPDVASLKESRSQWGEDQYAYSHFFYQRGGGTFLEMVGPPSRTLWRRMGTCSAERSLRLTPVSTSFCLDPMQGALDGLFLSNTYALEKMLGWTGVLVEASPLSYQALAVNRPGQVTVHCAVCGKAQVVHYVAGPHPATSGIPQFM
jgi:hypothetical protein